MEIFFKIFVITIFQRKHANGRQGKAGKGIGYRRVGVWKSKNSVMRDMVSLFKMEKGGAWKEVINCKRVKINSWRACKVQIDEKVCASEAWITNAWVSDDNFFTMRGSIRSWPREVYGFDGNEFVVRGWLILQFFVLLARNDLTYDICKVTCD